MRSILKNISYSLSSNLLSTLTSILIIFLIPKSFGPTEYGFYQLYIFYVTYVGIFHFGWIDGIYLKFGGKEYDKLDKKYFFSQFWELFIFQVIISLTIGLVFLFFFSTINMFIVISALVALVLTNVRYFLIYLQQATNRIKEASITTLFDRGIYLIFIFLILLFGLKNYKLLILSDLLARLLSLIYSTVQAKDIVFLSIDYLFYSKIRNIIENIKVGSHLMFSNLASKLVVGIVRFGIQTNWSVATFGKISLSISISNFLMSFISAFGMVFYPILRNINKENQKKFYICIRSILMVVLLLALVIYFPLRLFLSHWLPSYKESLYYMGIIFPICVFDGKMSLLINTFLKALRKEKVMAFINIISVVISVIVTSINIYIFNSLLLCVISIVFLIAIRSIISEIVISKFLDVKVSLDIFLELMMSISFIIISIMFFSVFGMLVYMMLYLLYLFLKKDEIMQAINLVKKSEF